MKSIVQGTRKQGSRRWKSAAFACLVALACVSLTSTTRAADKATVIVVIGAEGTPEFGVTFNKAADKWQDAATKAGADFLMIGRDPLPRATAIAGAGGAGGPESQPATMPATKPAYKTDKQRLQEKLQAETAEPNRQLWLIFIGHGTSDRTEAKFNLRDSDISDVELANWTKPMKRPLAVIDCSASSSPYLQKLSAPNHVIITATRSGTEINYSRLGEYLAGAIADPAADLDKDGQTSLLEAFVAGAHRTKEFYDTEGRLMTEHALIDDNGDGQGTPSEWFQGIRVVRTAATPGPGGRGGAGAARGPAVPDGTRAHQWVLVPSTQELALSDEARAQRNDLEARVEVLRARKGSIVESEYYAQLDAIFLQLAEIYKSAAK